MEYDSLGLAYDTSLEEATLGSILHLPGRLPELLAEHKLRPSSFFLNRNRKVFDTIIELFEKGTPPTETLVSSSLNGEVPKDYIYEIFEKVPAPSNISHYAIRLVELEKWRARREAALKALEATKERDLEKFSKAKALLDGDEIYANSAKDPKETGDRFKEFIEEEELEAFELPYRRLNEAMGGGLRRKQMSLMGGWSSHGKSVVMDEFLEFFSKAGHNCHLYINEMGEEDRVARSVSRETAIPYQRLIQHKITGAEKQEIYACLDRGSPYFTITECAGWSIHELAYDIKSRNYDVVGVDILHLLDYDSEIELAKISRLLNRTAKQSNCHIIATVHLNEFRANDHHRPRPVLRDIRGSGMLKNDADNVFFIYREQDQNGDPTASAWIYSSKVRNGKLENVPLIFNEKQFGFEELP